VRALRRAGAPREHAYANRLNARLKREQQAADACVVADLRASIGTSAATAAPAKYDPGRMRHTAIPTAAASTRRRVRVVTLTDYAGTHGGAEEMALAIATRLDPARFDSTLCISRWPLPEPLRAGSEYAVEQLSAAGARLLGLGRTRKLDVWVWAKLVRFLRRERVDVLHAHKFGSNVWGVALGRLAGVPVVLAHEHSWSYEGQPMRRLLDRELIARGADRLIAVSREDQRRMVEVERIARERTLFLPNGVPAGAPSSGRDVRAELGIAPDVPLIGTVGVLRPPKDQHLLIRATALLLERWPRLRTLIVGDGPDRASLEALAAELGVERAVRFLGRRNDVPDILQAFDIGVNSSSSEGSPLAVMEYMEAGLPVIATAVGGVPDLIEPGVHGLLVAHDARALADALAELLADPERAREMGARGRERRRAEFDIDVLVHRLEGLYVELLHERGVVLD
jgi:glycosyltransferase involved in cell wall biosynthesis